MLIQSAFILLLVIGWSEGDFQEESSTRAIVIVARHGDRVPSTTYPGDPHAHLFHSMMGNLTTNGCIRMYKNAWLLNKIIPALKDADHRYFYSDTTTRCVQSTECFKSGLIGEQGDLEPIVTGDELDLILNHPKLRYICSNYDQEQKDSEDHRRIFHQYSYVIHQLSQITGLKLTEDMANLIAYTIVDSMHTEHRLGLPMPSWFTHALKHLSKEYMEKARFIYSRLPIIRKNSVLLLKELTEQLQNSPNDSMSLFVYMTHDAVLGPALATLNITRNVFPNYGESLIIRLTNDHQLRFDYFNIHGKLEQLTPINCQVDNCSMETFASTVSNFTAFDWQKDCIPMTAQGKSGINNETINPTVTLIMLFVSCALTRLI